MADQLMRLGDYSKPKPKGFYFNLYEWVELINLPMKEQMVDPKDYFITSGEAIIKGTKLEQDLWRIYEDLVSEAIEVLADKYEDPVNSLRLGKLGKEDRELQMCLVISWRGACQARYLITHLTEARGAHLFLETDWSEGQVVCYPKNPRGVKF